MTISTLMLQILRDNLHVQQINLSSNPLGPKLGGQIAALTFARQLQELDLRNTNIRPNDKLVIDSAILENRSKL